MAAEGVDIEIVERQKANEPVQVVVPNHVIINGQEVLIPADSRILVSDIASDDIVTVTVTMMVRSLTIRPDTGVGVEISKNRSA